MDAHLIEQVKASVDLVKIAEGYGLRFRRSGLNHTARCPFHNEKTGSFCVNQRKQLYRCHGCSAGGDVVKFIQEIEHVPFMEAVKILATMGGVSIVELTEEDKRAFQERRRAQEAEQKAFQKWQADLQALLYGAWAGQDALNYLSLRWLTRHRFPTSDFDVSRENLAWELQFTTEVRLDRLKRALNLLAAMQQSMVLDLFRNQQFWLRGPRAPRMELPEDVAVLAYEDRATAMFAVVERAKDDFWMAAGILRDGVEAANGSVAKSPARRAA